MKISSIIPVYNNEETIEHVIKVLKLHSEISEIIVVNDGSRDNSLKIIEKIPAIKLINHPQNKGKGAAIVAGWKVAKNEHILNIDADLANLALEHIDKMIALYKTEGLDMVIGYSDLFSWVSGQRIYRKTTVMPFFTTAETVGNGIEQVINYAHRGKRINMVHTSNIGHILKYQRHPISYAMWLYLKEAWQLARTEYKLRTYFLSDYFKF